MALINRDEAKVGTYGYHEPQPEHLYDPRAIGIISIFQYGRNAAEDGLKRIGTNFKVRFERAQTDEAIKVAKKVVKALNAGTYEGPDVTCVSNGRPRGRQKAAA
jgi:hypothetical protein